jgi:flagellar protein FlaI
MGATSEGLGWKVKKEKAQYKINLPVLSDEEEGVIIEIARMFKELSKKEEVSGRDEAREKLGALIEEYCSSNSISIDREQFGYLCKMALLHTYGFCAIDPLLSDNGIEEIAVIGLNKPIYVYVREKGWKRTNAYFTSNEVLTNIINKMARVMGRRITFQSPCLNTILPDGSRLHASIPPISPYELTIRKFRENPISVPELISLNTFSQESLGVLWLLMQSDLSVIISGNTSSGKTTTLNALFSFVPLSERVLITEETPEINIPHEHVVHLVSNRELGISMSDLVADSLRMRPDRVIVGEARTKEEVGALIETILSGQARGSYATFHAQSGKETLNRMRSLGVLPIDLQSIDLIIVQRRMMRYDTKTKRSTEIRRVVEIAEIDKEKEGSLVPLFSYDNEKDILVKSNNGSPLLERVRKSFNMTKGELNEEIKRRSSFLNELRKKGTSFQDSVSSIQRFAYAD